MSNIYTNEEALTKLCPVTRDKCVGINCMLWTTYYELMPQTFSNGFPLPPKHEKTDKGYCGLGRK